MAKPPKVRQRARRDRNHSEIVRAIERAGASWFDTSNIGGGLDGIIGVAGIDQRIEIKDGELPPSEKKLTEAEVDAFSTWRGRKPVIIENVDDVVKLINQIRRENANTKRN